MEARRDKLTVLSKIYLAAKKLTQDGHDVFTTPQLVMAAWNEFPDTFGLKGFEAHSADSNKVKSVLCGRSGLVARLLLVKVAPDTYQLRETGPTGDEAYLTSLLDRRAGRKWLQGYKQSITFDDAQEFLAGKTEELLLDLERRDDGLPKLRTARNLVAYLLERFEAQFRTQRKRVS